MIYGLSGRRLGIGGVVVFLLLLVGGTLIFFSGKPTSDPLIEEVVTPEPPGAPRSIGTSVEGRTIDAYTFGSGDKEVLFVGGIHGGYEWNSVLLAYQFMDYLETDPSVIPQGMRVTVIPSLNPDGVYAVIGKEGRFAATDAPPEAETVKGRFNANGVDLNRNFACKWAPTSTWRGNAVSAGTSAFSEPEADALRRYVEATVPVATVFWHSQSNAVYASECEAGVLPLTRAIMNTYATAAGYKAVESFDAYPITGDVEGWLASIGIPAITVELATHTSIEWEKNRAGSVALLQSLE